MRQLLLLALLACACSASRETFVYGADVHLALRQLRTTGQASVSTHERYDGRLNEPEQEVVRFDQQVTVKSPAADANPITLRALAEHCTDEYEAPQDRLCMLSKFGTSELVLRSKAGSDDSAIGTGIKATLIGGIIIGGVTCGIACDAPISTVSWVGTGVFVLGALIYSCISSQSCHD